MAFIADDFNRANNASVLGTTSTGGATWSTLTGTFGINTNKARSPASGAAAIAVVDCGEADGIVAVTIAARTAPDQLGVAFRNATNGNGYVVESGNGSSKATLYKAVSGTYTSIAQSAANTAFVTNDIVSVVMSGSSLTVKLNGTTIITATDSTYNSVTKHGLYAFGGTAVHDFDNFSFTPIHATVTAPAATATSSGIAPTVSASSTATAPAATSTATAATPSLTATSTVAPPAATATADATAPVVSADSTVAAPAADAVADGLAPVVTVPGNATVLAPAATATADALAPTLAWDNTVTTPAASATADAIAPTVSAGSSVAATTATATADALPPVVTSVSADATVNAPTATASALAPAPSVAAVYSTDTDTSNMFAGLSMLSLGTVTITRPAASTPSNVGVKVDKAIPYPQPVMVDGRPT